MIETRRLKNIVIFIQTILSFVLLRKIEKLVKQINKNDQVQNIYYNY